MKISFTILIMLLAFGRVVLGQGREESGLPGYQQTELIKSVKLYPNPATDFISIKFETLDAKNIKLRLHNIIGNLVDIDIEVIDDHVIRLKIKDLPSGYYLVSINDESAGFKGIYKFLKK